MQLPVNILLQGGKYKIIRFINSGGFGCTYEAEHSLSKAHVAIKEFFKEDMCNRDGSTNKVTVGVRSKVETVSKLKKKFLEEATSVFQMKHPGIVRVIDIFEENGTAYYVMDFIDGCSLEDLLKRRRKLPEKEALHYILQVVDALQYVHAHNRLHLDIKPGNIMVDKHGRAILIDFGASKHYNENSGKQDSTLLGINTPGYTPVEQAARNFSKFNPATDIYALGATLYKLLTGITPTASILRADEDDENEIFNYLPSTLSASTRKALVAAMQVRSINRPQNLEEFKKMLGADIANDEKTVFEDLADTVKATVVDVGNKDKNEDIECDFEDDEPSFFEKYWKLGLIGTLIICGIYFYSNRNTSSSTPETDIDTLSTVDSVVPIDSSSFLTTSQVHQKETKPSKLIQNKNEGHHKIDDSKRQESATSKLPEQRQTTTSLDIREESQSVKTDVVYDVAEQMPAFPGGTTKLMAYLRENIKYPVVAEENGIQGRVIVTFVVERDGTITNVKVVKSVDPALDKEAARIVKSMPKWNPGKHKGSTVRVKFTLPIIFSLK